MVTAKDIERTWTAAKEAADHARWLRALAPVDRARVASWVARAGARGRRSHWAFATWRLRFGTATDETIANELLRVATARPAPCSWCGSAAVVAVDVAGHTTCADCLSPGEALLFDAREHRAKNE